MTPTATPRSTTPASDAARMLELAAALRAIATLNNLIGARSVLLRAALEFDWLAGGAKE